MNRLLERAKAHYDSLPRRRIEIPEWGDAAGPAVITWTELTVRDHERIYAADSEGRPPIGSLIRLRAIINKACDADGKPLFDGMAEHDLRFSVAGDVVGRIANAILFDAGVIDDSGAAQSADSQIATEKNG